MQFKGSCLALQWLLLCIPMGAFSLCFLRWSVWKSNLQYCSFSY